MKLADLNLYELLMKNPAIPVTPKLQVKLAYEIASAFSAVHNLNVVHHGKLRMIFFSFLLFSS